jgi:hypothetical protein
MKKIILLASLAFSINANAQVPSYVPTNGLVGFWPFNGNANDESGNNNNGTVNGATLTADRFGNANKAYNFDGVNDYINFNSNSTFNLVNDITISCWSQSLNSSSNQVQLVWFGDAQSAKDPYSIAISSSNLFYFRKDVSTGSTIRQVNSTTSLNTNYFHIIGTYNVSANKMKIYINGLLQDSINVDFSINYATQNMFLNFASADNGATQFFKGNLDDIGIWNRALTQQEITDLYNGCQLSVSTQPINQSVNISNNAQFTTASSDSLSTYQWQTDLGVGFQNLNSVGQYSGTANDTLTIANTTLSNNNQPFRCIISSGACTDTSNVAILSVNNNVGINEFTQNNLFSVYPNPAKSQINVKADAKLLGSIYTIYDNTGKLVLTGKINSENTVIDLGNLSGGIYLFSVGENLKQTFKVIKE